MGWTYELNKNSDIFRGGVYETKEECIKDANEEAVEDGKNEFLIGETFEPDTSIDTEYLLEIVGDRAYDDVGEVAEDYLRNVKKEDLKELDQELNEVFDKWKKKYGYEASFYHVGNIETIKVNKELD